MAIYVEYEGIKANGTADGFKDHLQVEAVNFGVNRSLTMEPGKMANRESGKPFITEVSLSKTVDNSVSVLFKESVSGSVGKKVTIKFVRTAQDKVAVFMTYTLTDCLVSSYNISAVGDETPTENITLSFSKCEISYTEFDANNKAGSPKRAGYDLAAAKAV